MSFVRTFVSLACVAAGTFASIVSCGGGVASSSGGGDASDDARPNDAGEAIDATDAHANDASDANDARADAAVLDAESLSCGPTLVCANATQFCQESTGGPPPPPDSGPGVGYSCFAFPSACVSDHSCACLRAHQLCGGGLIVDCRDTGAGVIASCGFP